MDKPTIIVTDEEVFQNLISDVKMIKEALGHGHQRDRGNEWITSHQVMKKLSISAKTLQTYRDRKILPFTQYASKILYRESDIETYLMSHYVPARKS